MPRKPVISDFNEFVTKMTGNDETIKRQLFEDLLYAQKERARLREKSKRQRQQKKALVPAPVQVADDTQPPA